MRLHLHDDGRSYRYRIEIESQGLPRLVTKFRGDASAEGQVEVGREGEPTRYDAVYDLRKRRDRHTSLRFVVRDDAVLAERGPQDTSRKPPLAEAFRRNVVDPLTALERIRAMLRDGRAAGADHFSVPVYDGARRFDAVGQVQPKKDGAQSREIRLILRPIAGFKGESSDDGDPDDAPRPVNLSVSDDTQLVPLKVTVRVFLMPLVVQLHRLCASLEACS